MNPSDTAPALIALDAKFVVQTPKGEQVLDAENYFVGPDLDITHMNILKPGYLLTAIRIPYMWAGTQVLFRKNPRPKRVGFSTHECCVRNEDFWRFDSGYTNRG